MFTKVGARVPLYCSGVGKVFLAAQSRNMNRLHPFYGVPLDPRALFDEKSWHVFVAISC